MRRKSWLEHIGLVRSPAHGTVTTLAAAGFTLRQLERRRVLDASAVGFVIPVEMIDQEATAAVSTESGAAPQFDWSAAQNTDVVAGRSVAESADVGSGASTSGGSGIARGIADNVLTMVVAPDQIVDEGALLSIENIGNVTDAGQVDSITFIINWGDGSPADTGLATIDQPGFGTEPTLASFDASHVYAVPGDYLIDVGVVSESGSFVTFIDVTVRNLPPELTLPGDQTVSEGGLLEIENLGQLADPEFGPTPGTEPEFSYAIDWGDGTTVELGTATLDQLGGEGTPHLASFDGAHTYADNGTYTVEVTVQDGEGGTTVDSFSVEVENVAPVLTVASDQLIDEGATLEIENLGTIVDPGFDNPVLGSSETFSYSVDWGDGTAPNVGNATIDAPGGVDTPTQASLDGSHVYADNGIYTVTVTVTDDDGGTDEQTLEVTVGNVAPTLNVAGDQTIEEGSELVIVNLGTITDPAFASGELGNDKVFDYVIDWGDGTTSDTGTATIDQPGSEGVPTTASFDGAHTYADNGVYTVTVTVMDDDGGMDQGTLMVTVGNVAPTLNVAGDQTIDEGSELVIVNLGTITDPAFASGELGNDKVFDYVIDWGDGITSDTGTATIDQPGSEGVPTTASFDGTHTYADNGVYTVMVSVTDDDGGSDERLFLVTVENVAPTLEVVKNQTIERRQRVGGR